MNINQNNQFGNNNVFIGDQPRIINDQLKDSLKQELKKILDEGDRKIILGVTSQDSETLNFYNQIKSFLVENGFNIESDGMVYFYGSTPSNQDVSLNIQTPGKILISVRPKPVR